MKVIFMGTPEFSVGTLEALVDAGHQVTLAVTQPDKPKGRGKAVQFPPVKEAALAHGIPVFQPVRVREEQCIQKLRQYEADVIVVVAFGQILPREILEMTRYGCINVHASLLPKYRGAAPIQWALLDGEQVTGVTTMQMDEGLDTGDMLLKSQVTIEEKETGGSLHDKLAKAGAALCVETLKKLEEGSLVPEKQGDSPTSYAKMLDKKLGQINWAAPAAQIERLVRGLNPWPAAYTFWEGKTMKLWDTRVLAEGSDAVPGTVIRVEKDCFAVQAGKGVLEILTLQIPGKRQMDAGDFLRGNRLEPGTVLGKIEKEEE